MTLLNPYGAPSVLQSPPGVLAAMTGDPSPSPFFNPFPAPLTPEVATPRWFPAPWSGPPPPVTTPAQERPPGDVRTSVRTYANPVFDRNAPDPSVVRDADGTYYAYTTETDGLKFQVLQSDDLVSWKRVGSAFRGSGPGWVDEHRWAPDVKKTGDHYTMLYSGRGDDGLMRIGYATARTPAGPFRDRGVLLQGDSIGYYIDPYLQKVGDRWVMYYGSTGGADQQGRHGISAVDVAIRPNGAMRTHGTGSVVLPEGDDRYLVEGAWVHKRGDAYYMFYSDGRWDARGGSEDYAVKVARSRSPKGPFRKLDEPILKQGNGITGPGHVAVVTDDAGKDWLLYHAWSRDTSKGRQLRLDPIEYEQGWPVVNSDRGPSTNRLDAPVIAALDGVSTIDATPRDGRPRPR